MIKEKVNYSKLTMRAITLLMCVIIAILSLGISASAADSRYTFQTDYIGSGETKSLTSKKKEYSSISMICHSTTAHATMQLWKDGVFGDTRYEQDQTISVGNNRRVWWFGDQSKSANYYIKASVSDNDGDTVAFTGYFRNFG